VAGQPKRQLQVGDDIDLRAPGIEKVRLTAKDVNNGEASVATDAAQNVLERPESQRAPYVIPDSDLTIAKQAGNR